jgi:hypothetical protein
MHELLRDERIAAGEPMITLGFTYHVGEDVEDIVTGLRHIDEAASLLLRRSGRLGHALSLGTDARRFYDRRGGETSPTVGMHLLDLVWAWGRLMHARDNEHTDWLLDAIAALGADYTCTSACFREMKLDGESVAQEDALLEALAFKGDPARRIPVRPDNRWVDLVGRLQSALKERLSRMRICVESCPTGNVVIGGYADYSELPAFPIAAGRIAVSINTDNPGLFMTSLPGEMAAMFEALMSTGADHQTASQWIRARVIDAHEFTFLGPVVPRGKAAADALCSRTLFAPRRLEFRGPIGN